MIEQYPGQAFDAKIGPTNDLTEDFHVETFLLGGIPQSVVQEMLADKALQERILSALSAGVDENGAPIYADEAGFMAMAASMWTDKTAIEEVRKEHKTNKGTVVVSASEEEQKTGSPTESPTESTTESPACPGCGSTDVIHEKKTLPCGCYDYECLQDTVHALITAECPHCGVPVYECYATKDWHTTEIVHDCDEKVYECQPDSVKEKHKQLICEACKTDGKTEAEYTYYACDTAAVAAHNTKCATCSVAQKKDVFYCSISESAAHVATCTAGHTYCPTTESEAHVKVCPEADGGCGNVYCPKSQANDHAPTGLTFDGCKHSIRECIFDRKNALYKLHLDGTAYTCPHCGSGIESCAELVNHDIIFCSKCNEYHSECKKCDVIAPLSAPRPKLQAVNELKDEAIVEQKQAPEQELEPKQEQAPEQVLEPDQTPEPEQVPEPDREPVPEQAHEAEQEPDQEAGREPQQEQEPAPLPEPVIKPEDPKPDEKEDSIT